MNIKALPSAAVLLSGVLLALFVSSYSYAQQSCSNYTFSNNKLYSTCSDLPALNSFLHWSYDSAKNVVDLAFRHTRTSSSRWVAWALNPSGQLMEGSRSLVAFQNSTGGRIRAYTCPIPSERTTLKEGSLRFGVSNLTATLVGNEWTIFARLHLTNDLISTNQVWQEGPMNGNTPGAHPFIGDNERSVGRIDFRTPQIASEGGRFSSRERRRNVHGVLNAVSWGILMPLGAMMARYLKVFKFANPAWFYLHVACQVSAYIIGVAGWATGIKLGIETNTPGRDYIHRNFGITLFCLGTLQMFALIFRPKPDHKYRIYWKIYHHSTGYAIIAMSIFNILKGLSLLNPEIQWWHTYMLVGSTSCGSRGHCFRSIVFCNLSQQYIVSAISLGVAIAVLEATTWSIVILRKKQNKAKHPRDSVNESDGHDAKTPPKPEA